MRGGHKRWMAQGRGQQMRSAKEGGRKREGKRRSVKRESLEIARKGAGDCTDEAVQKSIVQGINERGVPRRTCREESQQRGDASGWEEQGEESGIHRGEFGNKRSANASGYKGKERRCKWEVQTGGNAIGRADFGAEAQGLTPAFAPG